MRRLFARPAILSCSISAVSCLIAEPARANADDGPTPTPTPGARCPELFGDQAMRDVHALRRQELVFAIDEYDGVVDLTYRGRWGRPRRFMYEGLHLVETRESDDGAIALVEVESYADVDCPSGIYAIRIDHAIGADAHVLAVLDRDMILIEDEGRLGYLRTSETKPPIWRLNWDSGIRFRRRFDPSSVSRSRSKRPKRPRGRRGRK